MSGGSHSYMYQDDYPSRDSLEYMLDSLCYHLANAPDDGAVVYKLSEAVKKTKELIGDPIPSWLRDIWKEVEWLESNDTGRDQFYRNVSNIETA